MIGTLYDKDKWNCTHEVADWYKRHGYENAVTPVSSDKWGITFIRWMRNNFTPIDLPEHGSLVVMRNKFEGGLHIGVWDNGMIHHCFLPLTGGPGQTIRSPIHMVKLNHVILRYGKYNGADIIF